MRLPPPWPRFWEHYVYKPVTSPHTDTHFRAVCWSRSEYLTLDLQESLSPSSKIYLGLSKQMPLTFPDALSTALTWDHVTSEGLQTCLCLTNTPRPSPPAPPLSCCLFLLLGRCSFACRRDFFKLNSPPLCPVKRHLLTPLSWPAHAPQKHRTSGNFEVFIKGLRVYRNSIINSFELIFLSKLP